jgi:sporulation protein YlmC with PRC-barrel domain
MMATSYTTKGAQTTLVKLGDTDLTVADPAEDIRGRKVFDRDGEEMGKVDGLMIDESERKVRFLEVSGGGFLGIGDQTVMIPVDSITRIDKDHVYIDQTHAHVAGGPRYDPSLIKDPGFWGTAYDYYGVSPYWSSGYMYPGYPFYR